MRVRSMLALTSGLVLVLAGCGANQAADTPEDTGSTGGGAADTGLVVGVILPDTESSARWEGFDKPYLENAFAEAGVEADVQNAQGDIQRFSTIADQMIQRGVDVLALTNLSNESGAAVQQRAEAAGIPTIDYDRLTLGGNAQYYVSFDNTQVGRLQGEGLVGCLGDQPGAQIIEIQGSPTDSNATLFQEGQREILQPLYDSGEYELVQSQPIDQWENQVGGRTFQQILTRNGGEVDGVVAANDGLAGAVITVLQQAGLAGEVPVTGQDASPEGLRSILLGDQCMTVYKPVFTEAQALVDLAVPLAQGDTEAADALASDVSVDTEGDREVASVLLEPVLITTDNVQTVVDDEWVSVEDLCAGEVADACTEYGIS
ncbi:sugar ABC transporter substrate-binding protein [Actinoalloteichus hoggarensis]|uniref:D-xylose-binding periplasmic protein n=1 Tax=Actinoalloteichus hoggarensis TaxID=1470176 RepID=A0A221W0Y2_9PSEU|nr:substrate-binding domain-containing protein [Actinoalloteichus hoggarensis]ASO19221.1 D-xylose-binding periplasmic protein precursor [Actinoalloteichus hoggarensis]